MQLLTSGRRHSETLLKEGFILQQPLTKVWSLPRLVLRGLDHKVPTPMSLRYTRSVLPQNLLP